MRILFPYNDWAGGFQDSIVNACKELGHEVYCCHRYKPSMVSRLLFRSGGYLNSEIKKKIQDIRVKNANDDLIKHMISFKPDVFF